MNISICGTVPNMIILSLSIGMIVLSGSVVGCSQKSVDDHGGQKEMLAKTIDEVLGEHTDEWMSIPGVVGTAIGQCEGKPCIRVMVVKKTQELMKKIPASVEGFVVDVQETGEIRALDPT